MENKTKAELEKPTMEKAIEQMKEEAVKRANEIYPRANIDDFPDNPDVNRINNACRPAFMNGFTFAFQFFNEIESSKDKERIRDVWDNARLKDKSGETFEYVYESFEDYMKDAGEPVVSKDKERTYTREEVFNIIKTLNRFSREKKKWFSDEQLQEWFERKDNPTE